MLARRCGQPVVIGQIVTGVLLGPSVLGRLPGHLTSRIFPITALPFLNVLAQVAVAIFMFTVGYEIEFGSIRRYGRTVPVLAIGALALPMALGIGAVLLMHPELAGMGTAHQGRSFVLFMGVATSITALPVLASIVRDRNLAGTTAGVISTAAAGLMDVIAWLVLAAALIGTGHSGRFSLWVTIILVLVFIAVMLIVVRPLMAWWESRSQSVLYSPVPVAFALAMACAWVTAYLGLHPMFGAFVAGLALRGTKRQPDEEVMRAMDQAGNMLLPLFFVITGLSLNIGAMGGDAISVLAVTVAVACVGKLLPGYWIPRWSGLSRKDSWTISALVNTRGLTELIALNAGLADGIIDSKLFTVLILMALITTLATGPLLSAVRPTTEQIIQPEPAIPSPDHLG
jgi:Kef-type K+ transport system membrane component KefB